ncbi:hypothetical protein CERSUDRAFT_114448 [Gelatoporia subvermispora B]|uniref:RTA1 like protein n=1 Tax=Ceriporiopsis subvermispora (strain B) TaxID=914234 RepID=M2PMZ0_CERS8|nr:hypothetical protein CERSUDRAFT_114448 [Gelatoporia subvermispora B]
MLRGLSMLCFTLLWAVSPTAADSGVDPKDDVRNPLRYIPSNTLTVIALIVVLLVGVSQGYLFWRYKGKCMLPMLIGIWTYALGFVVRFVLHSNPDSIGTYIVEQLFIVLSPCAFIATEYMIFGRLASYLDGDQYLPISPRKIARTFVISDVITFSVQGGGSGFTTSQSQSLLKLGQDIFLAGLILQLISFSVFVAMYVRFLLLVRKSEPLLWHDDQNKPWYKDWRCLAYAILISSIGVFVRCMYRVIELSQGFTGHLTTTESYFYALDTLPLCIAIAMYVPFWPGRFITHIDNPMSRKMLVEGYRMAPQPRSV